MMELEMREHHSRTWVSARTNPRVGGLANLSRGMVAHCVCLGLALDGLKLMLCHRCVPPPG